jgi:hypothetical protein
VIVYDGAAQADNLVAQVFSDHAKLCVERVEIGSHVRPQRVNVSAKVIPDAMHLRAHIRHLATHLAQELQNGVYRFVGQCSLRAAWLAAVAFLF